MLPAVCVLFPTLTPTPPRRSTHPQASALDDLLVTPLWDNDGNPLRVFTTENGTKRPGLCLDLPRFESWVRSVCGEMTPEELEDFMTGLVEHAATLIPESEISRRRAVLAMTMSGPGDEGYEGIRSPSPRMSPQLTGRMLLDMADTVVLSVKCQTMHKIKLEVPRDIWIEQLIAKLKEKYELPEAAEVSSPNLARHTLFCDIWRHRRR